MKRHRPSQTGKSRGLADEDDPRPLDPRTERRLHAAHRILIALKRLDEARASVPAALDDLTSEVNQPDMPKHVRADFDKFWRAGGCTSEQYRQWLSGKRPEAVSKRKHLRLVSNRTHRSRARLSRQHLSAGPDDGPQAA
jgi:hypothetical protein